MTPDVGGKAAHDNAGDDSAPERRGGNPEHGRQAGELCKVPSSSGMRPAMRLEAAAATANGSCPVEGRPVRVGEKHGLAQVGIGKKQQRQQTESEAPSPEKLHRQ